MLPFKLAINMAGAVSAGAYTAGVLDFLIEALDEWHKEKAGGAVPPHDVSIEAFSGASAGGMCAAISAALTQEEFDHIQDTKKLGTSNRLYEAWVNRIDISDLLTVDDLKSATGIPSLLDSSIIQRIAEYALKPGPQKPRPYISPRLNLFLTITNLRGVPYALFEGQDLTPNEYVTFHADRLRFEMVNPGENTRTPDAHPLLRGKADDKSWELLRTAAMATGAFPAFLAPRVLERNMDEYTEPLWNPICAPDNKRDKIHPSWGPDQKPGSTWASVNVDGGVTNNSPFILAHDYLATLDPAPRDCENPSDPKLADRAVLTVAPFPGNAKWSSTYDALRECSLFSVVPRLFSTLIAQTRFFGESLAVVTGAPSFSRFFIAPSDDRNPTQPALQCGLLGAFGGFFNRGFRAHDFQLGRRNCQKFLDQHFILPISNPLFDALRALDSSRRDEIIERFKRAAPPEWANGEPWIPIVPLCGTARHEVEYPNPAKITEESLDKIVDSILRRMKAILPLVLTNLDSGLLRFLIKWGVGALMVVFGGKGELKKYLMKSLGTAVELK